MNGIPIISPDCDNTESTHSGSKWNASLLRTGCEAELQRSYIPVR